MIVLSLGIDLLKHLGYSKAVDYTWEHGRSCLILSFFFAINTVIGENLFVFSQILNLRCNKENVKTEKFTKILALFALNGMNIPMYNAMRRCVPIANLLLGVIFLRTRPSKGITISVLTITSGTFVAGKSKIIFRRS